MKRSLPALFCRRSEVGQNGEPNSTENNAVFLEAMTHSTMNSSGDLTIFNQPSLLGRSVKTTPETILKAFEGIQPQGKEDTERAPSNFNKGQWTKEERLLFLKGLRACGWGKWKEISESYLATRSCRQVKCHGLKTKARFEEGKPVLEELLLAEATGIAPQTPRHAFVSPPLHRDFAPLRHARTEVHVTRITTKKRDCLSRTQILPGNEMTPHNGNVSRQRALRLIFNASDAEMTAAIALCSFQGCS